MATPALQLDDLWTVLPRNSTALEKDMLRITPFKPVLDPLVAILNTFKHQDIPGNILPWLDIEYGLGRLAEFLPDARTRLSEGLVFNRQIGTKAGVLQAAGWLGVTANLWEEPEPTVHFAEWQLELLSDIPALSVFCQLAKVMKIAGPCRGRFRRIFNAAWNVDRFRLDRSDWGDLLSDYSGLKLDGLGCCKNTTGLVVSLGRSTWMVESDGTSLNVMGDTPAESLLIRERESFMEVVPPGWPELDDDYFYSFYPRYMVADMCATHLDDISDDSGGPMRDDSGGVILPDS